MRTIPLLFALFTAASALAALEVQVSQPVFGPPQGNQFQPAVASDGERYLVVWTDERSGVAQEYGARLSGDGTVLDPHGIRIATSALTYSTRVIWSGSSWFVLSNDCNGISLARLDRDGRLLDATPRVLPIRAWCPTMSVATDGRRVAVGYVTGSPKYEAHALILGEDGHALADVYLSAGAYEPPTLAPAIAWDGSSFVAVWGGHAARFDANGIHGSLRDVLFLGFASSSFAIASDGRDFLVVRGGLTYRMKADLTAEYVQPLPFPDVQSISWTGSEYVVIGADPSTKPTTLNVVRLDREGHAVGAQTMSSTGTSQHREFGSAAATNGRNVLVAWHDSNLAPEYPLYVDSDTYASILSLPSLTPEPRKALSASPGGQANPVVAAGETNQLTIWTEKSGLQARRHRRDGTTDDAPLRLTAQATSAAAVFNGSDYLVATTEGRSVVVRRLGARGELRVDRESRLEVQTPRYVALASDGTNTLAAWLDNGIYAARVAADGTVIDKTPLQVAPAALSRNTQRISIASGRDGEFLIVWGGTVPGCEFCSPSYPAATGPLRAARVTATLSLLDPIPIPVAIPLTGSDAGNPANPRYDPLHTLNADQPSAAWDGQEWLVVWNRAFNDLVGGSTVTREEIRGRRIARNGTLLDGTSSDPGVLIASNSYSPTIARNGSSYLLAWREGSPRRSGLSPRLLQPMHVASLDRLGAAPADERTLGESLDDDAISISVSSGFAALAYARVADAPRYGGVSRAFLVVPDSDARRRTVRR